MKKILFRKLLLDYTSFFLIALLSASIIIWVFQAVNYLDLMIEDGRDYIVYISFSILNFPKIISKLYPFVLFFSLFYVIIKYETSNELLIFWNFGVNKIEIINFIMKVSLVMMIVQILFSAILVPVAQDKARSFLRTSTVNFFGNFIKQQRFNDTIKGVTIYSEKKDNEGNLYNLYLKKEIDRDDFEITYAKKGVFKEKNQIPVLVLFDGETITGKNNEITNFSFSKSDFPLNNIKGNLTTYKKTQEISTRNLLKCIKEIYKSKNEMLNLNIENCSLKNKGNIFKETYKRIIIPFYIPLLMIVPFLLILSSKENLNYFRIKLLTFCLGLFLIIFSETTIRLISEMVIRNIGISIIPLVLFLILYFCLVKKFNFKIEIK